MKEPKTVRKHLINKLASKLKAKGSGTKKEFEVLTARFCLEEGLRKDKVDLYAQYLIDQGKLILGSSLSWKYID